MKTCIVCNVPKELNCFAENRNQCKQCRNTYTSRLQTSKYNKDAKFREQLLAEQKARRLKNPAKRKTSQKKYYNQNRDQYYINKSKRRAKKAGNGGSHTVEEWKQLKDKYSNICLCCKRDDVKLTKDHVLPIVLGGTDNIDNIQPLCLYCNKSKHDKHIDYRTSV